MSNHDIDELQQRIEVLRNRAPVVDDGTIWCPQEEIVNLLSLVTEQLHAKNLEREAYRSAVDRLTTIETNIEHINKNIASLCKVVRDGNGQPSMIQRLAKAETMIHNNQEDIDEIRGHANTIIAAKALSRSQIIAGFTGMVITAILSSLALLATLLK